VTTDVLPRIPSIAFARVTLHVLEGTDAGVAFRLDAGATRVGTGPTCLVQLHDPSVSRVHCEIRVDPDGVTIIDLGSTNGTSIDGVEVREALLRSGARVRLGATTLQVAVGDQPITMLIPERDRFGAVLGKSTAMRRLYGLLERVAPTESTVLLRGETGTGKEMVARAIHNASKRARGPFVAVDCGAIAETLIESELFGHVRGAFSGASADRRGLFEEANSGTIFLDEIGELPLQSQPKLLRALELREVRRVGGNTATRLDVRVVAATHRPLAASVNDGTFREDLYYRLAVFEITLPPLRDRREDIPLLAQHFYEQVTGDKTPLPPAVLDSLAHRSWSGNIRELKNFVERSACLGWSGEWTAEPPRQAPVPAVEGLVRADLPLSEARALWSRQFESLYCAALLARTGGNVTRAAELAGISRRSLHRILADNHIRHTREPDDAGD
jgi:transcriptional regulator with PAS, ATPase and Fis domain